VTPRPRSDDSAEAADARSRHRVGRSATELAPLEEMRDRKVRLRVPQLEDHRRFAEGVHEAMGLTDRAMGKAPEAIGFSVFANDFPRIPSVAFP